MARRMKELVDLQPIERRVALMYVAEASKNTIALFLGTSAEEITHILARPHVHHYVLAQQATYASELTSGYKDINHALEDYATRAFEVEVTNMERMHELGDHPDPRVAIKAALGATYTAQDILDRAGKRAPTKSINAHLHSISPDNIEQLGEVMREVLDRSPRDFSQIEKTVPPPNAPEKSQGTDV